MSSELLPCPFCGSKAEMYINYAWSHSAYTILCSNSLCAVCPMVECDTEEEVVKAWNTRVEKTCVMKSIKHGPLYDVFQCTNCGTEFAERNTEDYIDYEYCKVCGAKVVE